MVKPEARPSSIKIVVLLANEERGAPARNLSQHFFCLILYLALAYTQLLHQGVVEENSAILGDRAIAGLGVVGDGDFSGNHNIKGGTKLLCHFDRDGYPATWDSQDNSLA